MSKPDRPELRAEMLAAMQQAQADERAWVTRDFERALALMNEIGGLDADAARPKLTEAWVQGPCMVAFVPRGKYLRAGAWHATTGTLGTEPALFVVVVVKRIEGFSRRAGKEG